MELDLEELAVVLELLEKANFSDFRLEKGDLRISIRRGGQLPDDDGRPNQTGPVDRAPPSSRRTEAPSDTLGVVKIAASAPTDLPPPDQRGEDQVVASPMLGVFYRAPKPGEPPFVQIGAEIGAGDYLCVIEVMKLFTSVAGGVAGVVTSVLAKDGDLVEFGQPLFTVRPAP